MQPTVEPESDGGLSARVAGDRLIALLDSEIDHIRAQQSQGGWTQWALLGSLTAILVFLASQAENHSPDLMNTLFVLLLTALSLDFIKLTGPIANFESLSRHPTRRFHLADAVFSPSRIAAFVRTARAIALVFVALQLQTTLSMFFVVATCLFYSIHALFGIIAIGLSLTRIPIYAAETSHVVVFYIIVVSPAVIALVGLVSAVLSRSVMPAIPEFRVGVAMAASLAILQWLAEGSSRTPPLIATLARVRREFSLGRLDLDSAKRQAEIALLGMTLTDYVQRDVENIISGYAKLVTQHENIGKTLETSATILESDESELSPSQLQSIRDSIRRVRAVLDEARITSDGIDEDLAGMGKRMKRAIRSIDAVETIDRLFDEIDETVQLATTNIWLEVERTSQLMDRIDVGLESRGQSVDD